MPTGSAKRKLRRRSVWERGIIRKKKSSKKEEAEEDEEPEDEEGAEDSTGAGQGDASLVQDDESSCDTMEPQHNRQLTQPNGYALSTEEESSNEPTVTQDPGDSDTAKTTTSKEAPPEEEKEASVITAPQECVNGDESMDSIDSEAPEKESEKDGKDGKELVDASKGDAQDGADDTVQECKTKECMSPADGAASDGDHEREGTVMHSIYMFILGH